MVLHNFVLPNDKEIRKVEQYWVVFGFRPPHTRREDGKMAKSSLSAAGFAGTPNAPFQVALFEATLFGIPRATGVCTGFFFFKNSGSMGIP